MNHPCAGMTRYLCLSAGLLALTLWIAGCAGGQRAPEPITVQGAAAGVTGSYAFWPLFPVDPRVQFVRSFSSSADLAPTERDALAEIVFGKETTSEAEVNKPYGVAMRNGKIYVCDMRASSLVVFDVPKKQTRLLGTTGPNRLSHPVAVAVADDGMIYVADNERGAVVVFDAQERYSQAIGFPKFKPAALAVHGNTLYASDLGAQSIQMFDRQSGAHTGSFGTVGDEDGQFRLPLGLATDRSGNVFVIDMMRCRLQKFGPDGKFIAATGYLGDVGGAFARPKHIAVDSDGIVYVIDSAFQNVQMFDAEFRLLMAFGAAGDFPGAMNLPAGIAVCDDGVEYFADRVHPGFEPKRLVVVTNQFGPAKVSVYAMGQLRAGYTAADLSKAAVKVPTGIGSSADVRELQEMGNLEEPKPVGEPGPAPEGPAAPVSQPQAPPSDPKR